MEALKTALQDGSSTVAWPVLRSALEQQAASRSGDGAGSSPSISERESAPQVQLDSGGLWKQFFAITNEMILTKAGRRMFPVLKVHLSGLEPTTKYAVLLEFRCTHQHRWRFLNGSWQKGSTSEDNAEHRHVFVHFSSLAPGSHWMQEPVSFAKLKLSNRENGSSKIQLNSLHKYQPYIHLIEMDSDPKKQLRINSFVYPETQFIAVTAYQNDKVTQMKIKNNPFAKAFLGSSSSERAHSTFYDSLVDVALGHDQLAGASPLLPSSHSHNNFSPSLTMSPPPYPGSISPLPPRYFQQTPTGGFQRDSYPSPHPQEQFVYPDYYGHVDVYAPDPTTSTLPHSSPHDYIPEFDPSFAYHLPEYLPPSEEAITTMPLTNNYNPFR